MPRKNTRTKKHVEQVIENDVPDLLPNTKDKVPEVVLTDEELAEIEAMNTLSAQIRHLHIKYTRGQIAKVLTKHRGKLVRYQHVRNVLETPLKKVKK